VQPRARIRKPSAQLESIQKQPPNMSQTESPSSSAEAGQDPLPDPASAALVPTHDSILKTKNPRYRRGAIARLPKNLRDQINLMLDDGLPYPLISKRLADNSGLSISDDSISRWKQGGYQDYLRELRLLNESRQRHELTLDLSREEQGIDAFQAAHKIAAALMPWKGPGTDPGVRQLGK